MKNKLFKNLQYLCLSILFSTVTVYSIGSLLTGAYTGEYGYFGFLYNVLGSALTGSLSAWLLVLSPILFILIWLLTSRVLGSIPKKIEE
ncbi:MAG: hypothetical protein VYA80_06755 [Pseudomonadota bacterium]|nr:hypothetical protein [Pseudomonadota bacterium]